MIKTLIVIPRGGLGNRVRVVNSAYRLCKKLGCKLYVVWQLTPELNCRYDNLFKVMEGITVVNTGARSSRGLELLCDSAAKIINRSVGFYDDSTRDDLVRKISDEMLPLQRTVVARVNDGFYATNLPPDWLSPHETLVAEIDSVCSRFPMHTVGIHIRRRDNQESVQVSRTESFIEKMDEMIQQNPEVKFFLATDCMSTQVLLCGRYGKNIFTREKVLNRNEPAGIQDALIDMYCLSRTDFIVGSYWSSFSEVASLLGKVPLVIAGK